jgi:hypothetical protein
MTEALQRHRERLQQASRRITGQPVCIVSAASVGLTVSPEVAALATGHHIILNREFGETDGQLLMTAFTAHELAHVVTANKPEHPDTVDSVTLSPVVSKSWREWPSHQGPFRWHGHDAQFIRTLCHVAHRMRGHGLPVVLPWAFHHRAYGLASLERYAKALGDECQSKDWLPLLEAMSGPMPEKFSKLWTADVLRSVKKGVRS